MTPSHPMKPAPNAGSARGQAGEAAAESRASRALLKSSDAAATKPAPMTPAERQRRHRARRKAELQALRQATADAQAGKGMLKGWAALDRVGVVERELKERAAAIKALRAERDALQHQLQALRAAVATGLAQLPLGTRQAVGQAISKAGGRLQDTPGAEAAP